MTIRFQCPNGHVLSAPEEQAGKTGQCPRCLVDFRVPEADAPAPEPELVGEPEAGAGEATSDPASKAAVEDKILFLCPNGHKLSGPASLQGKPGECPHCGARFRIPAREPDSAAASDSDPAIRTPPDSSDEFEAPLIPPPVADDELHPLAALLHRLWPAPGRDLVIELHLEADDVLTAQYFAPDLSQGDFGVFAVSGRDGEYVISAIPWSSVRRLSLRRVRELPAGLFR